VPRVTSSPNPHLSEEQAARAAAMTASVRKAAAGDQAALEALLVDAQEVAWRFSMAVCGHAEDAEDAMQDALVRTYRHIPQIREAESFRPWLYRTVRNACLMSRRKRVAEPTRVLSLDDMRALAKLPPSFRAVVFLRDMEGLSTREAATTLGISEDNVKARLHRARLFLRRELAGSDGKGKRQ
jgi:RNA polymerase sigma-70 factor (ECF subfamily)